MNPGVLLSTRQRTGCQPTTKTHPTQSVHHAEGQKPWRRGGKEPEKGSQQLISFLKQAPASVALAAPLAQGAGSQVRGKWRLPMASPPPAELLSPSPPSPTGRALWESGWLHPRPLTLSSQLRTLPPQNPKRGDKNRPLPWHAGTFESRDSAPLTGGPEGRSSDSPLPALLTCRPLPPGHWGRQDSFAFCYRKPDFRVLTVQDND